MLRNLSLRAGTLWLYAVLAAAMIASSIAFMTSPLPLGRTPLAVGARRSTTARAAAASRGPTMAELNKYSKTITQTKSQGASQVRISAQPRSKCSLSPCKVPKSTGNQLF